jgi:DNA polymerase-3 subunit epsilon/ATP-dependent DNA helicase DinG
MTKVTTRYVALDLETTGLDPERDEIIEVAAIAFDLEGVLEEFHSLVRPYRPPSYQIERLTGIGASALEVAPSFGAIASELADFIGHGPIVGQSVNFDLDFLVRSGVLPAGPSYDTFDLGQMLLPGLADYSLKGIAEQLGIEFPVRHRAREDADAARKVFLVLRERLTELPTWLLNEVERLAKAAVWPLAGLFQEVLAGRSRFDEVVGLTSEVLAAPEEIARPLNGGQTSRRADGREEDGRSSGSMGHRPFGELRAGSSSASGRADNGAEVVQILQQAGELAQFFADFERRPEQEAMAAAVAGALDESRHLVVEAGTGTGKSLAYLLPAALQALRRGERVVVSTDTIGLQEQLIEKDLPVVQALLSQVEREPLRVAALKGRRNYLCLQRWTAARHGAPVNKEDAQLQARLLMWLRWTQTGDRSELNLHSSFDQAWNRLAAENTACIQTQCPFVRDGTCFLLRARKRAEAAHILVVNHALLLSDLATGGHVLPPYDHVIIDEAHNLEDEATSRFAFRASEGDIGEFLDRVGRGERSGIAGVLNGAGRGSEQILGAGAYLAGIGAALQTAASRVRQRLGQPFKLLAAILRDTGQSERENDERLLITRATRVQPAWSSLQIAAEDLDKAFGDLLSLLDDLRGLLESQEQGLADQELVAAEVAELSGQGVALQSGLYRALLAEDASLICWLERSRQTGEVAVCTAPLEVAEILKANLFDAKESVILTSATLSTEASFDYLRERVGLEEADELLLGSPFDFPRSTLITLPTDLPDPNEPDFIAATSELLIEACRASQGRALVLFTAYGTLNAVYEAIKPALESEGILVLAHGTDGSPRQLLSALRENPRTVLLGTASFWEGVDVAGDALSLLVIVRLPFAVPTDPIYQARSQLYDEPFDQYAVPQAVLRFRQGFGRLIRTKTDRGVLLVLDGRVRNRRYGPAFLRSLPKCTVRELLAREVAGEIEGWLERPTSPLPAGIPSPSTERGS